MKTSAGFILVDGTGKVLVCHVTGCKHWDFPKGNIDEGESAIESAKRELKEETGLDFDSLNKIGLVDLGVRSYINSKNLNMFILQVSDVIDSKSLKCTSYLYSDRFKKTIPENDYFAMVDINQLIENNKAQADGQAEYLVNLSGGMHKFLINNSEIKESLTSYENQRKTG